jgi:hypothetical protein
MATYRDIVTGPRWAGISTFVKDAAFGRGLKLDIDIDKGWLRETVRLEVAGDDDSVVKFKCDLHDAILDYQKRTQSK